MVLALVQVVLAYKLLSVVIDLCRQRVLVLYTFVTSQCNVLLVCYPQARRRVCTARYL